MKARKKPVVIETVQWTGKNAGEIKDFIGENNFLFNLKDKEITIRTLEGDMNAIPGDYIIKGVKGEFYPCKPDIFEKTYDIKERPRIICICGSTKFADYHAIYKWNFEKLGCICLMINYLPGWYVKKMNWEPHHVGEQSGLKEHLDELHLRKIDLCDEVFVVNKDGYIGESTRSEIEYAKKLGKPIEYTEG